MKNFQESVDYLHSLGNEVEAMKLGLDNIRILLAALGNPETNYLKVQVAGTNGKGSVCAFLNSICFEAGIKTGLYTSPHLVSVTERVNINGVDISEEDFARLATRVRAESEMLVASGDLENVPTYFEQVTAIALVAFAEAKVELAILETGLGGRFDAVTAANAEICAITRIDFDHQQYLGETIEEIAAEKAAIIRNETTVVVIPQIREVEQIISGRCKEVGASLFWTTTNITVTTVDEDPTYKFHVFSFRTEKERYSMIEPNILGRHQGENMSVAIGVAEALRDRGLRIDSFNISLGLETAHHAGRLEWMRNFLLDGAHNVGGARALARYLNEFIKHPIMLIFGAMRDKNVAEIAEILWPRAEKVILTSPRNSRALSADDLSELKPVNFDESKLVKTSSIEEAIEVARAKTKKNETILITGSLYLVGEARQLLTREGK